MDVEIVENYIVAGGAAIMAVQVLVLWLILRKLK